MSATTKAIITAIATPEKRQDISGMRNHFPLQFLSAAIQNCGGFAAGSKLRSEA
jgi:hypothetical protein